MLGRSGWTVRGTSNGPFSPPAPHAIQYVLRILLLLLLVNTAPAAAEEPLCDMSPFIEQTPEGVAPCKTCFFPTYPGINSLELAKYPAQDFTNQWIYFSGDSTLRQVYGEFYGIIHRTQAPGYADLKHHSRQDCPHQLRDSYVPPPWDPTPCYLNEMTCHNHYNDTGMGQNIEITFDWKHLIYEDYDRALYNRWEAGKNRPQFLFVSPGIHDCYHAPEEYEHHARELAKLASHLASLQRQTVIWIDANPITYAVNNAAALKCMFYVNAAAHALAQQHGILMFSRQTMIVSGHQVNADDEYPMHQSDETVKTEVQHLLAWLGCALQHKKAGLLSS